MSEPTKVEDLPNTGITIARRLNEIGVFTEDDLRLMGAVDAHRRIRLNYPKRTLPVCYYLYSFEAALKGVHWDHLPDTRKRLLRNQLGEQGGA